MKKTFLLKNIPLLLAGTGLLLTVAFAQTTNSQQKRVVTDTIPTKQKKIRDLDEALAELDKGEEEMRRAFSEAEREKMQSDIRKAMKDVEKDMGKMQEDLARAMKELDMQKISLEVQQEMQKAMKEVDGEKISRQVKESLAKVDMAKIKADLEKVKEVDLSRVKAELEQIGPEIEKAMKEAKANVEKARAEITSYKNLVNALDKDGLLNKKGEYRIDYKDRQLTVNGKTLSAEATRKYNEYLKDKDHFTLEKNEEGLNIRNDK